MSTDHLTVISWNFENNGKNDPARRQAGDELLKSLNPDLVYRQELWKADASGRTIFHAQARMLGMHGELGGDSCTALFINPRRFSVIRDWAESRGPQYVLPPPTALTLRYEEAGPDALPFLAVSYHLNYASLTQRMLEAEWLTTWTDKKVTTPNGKSVTLPALIAGDNNSYPVPGAAGDPRLPEASEIKNAPHRVHRAVGLARRQLMVMPGATSALSAQISRPTEGDAWPGHPHRHPEPPDNPARRERRE
ncbi:hypothetical protein Sdia_36210 [Streptomyces diastaticus subsp. diastaticus]|uniref:Endonuclease/exonuclease/phosphatase family protein n=1 Tax=Streptomyces diastaticus subsp. diastaticus TaxID=68040 RepID=A0ABQ1CRP2_STRDI|nr:hypothetical protein [Streptomyces diastaticus]GFH72853.1 hypothetical protein Sdia_36210 [Streptomyces diastaticus subsp. diastaticus]GGU43071.1 hypothetical protein GCM10015534_52000 [Streptomyces diastaticus subsp. diastaticus]